MGVGFFLKEIFLRMTKKGVYIKIVVSFAAVIIISFIMTAVFLSYWFQSYFIVAKDKQLNQMSDKIKIDVINYYSELNDSITNLDELQSMIDFVGKATESYIWIVDTNGFRYARSNDNKNNDSIQGQLTDKQLESLRSNKFVQEEGAFPGEYLSTTHSYMIPIFSNSDTVFYGAIIMNTDSKDIKAPLTVVYKIIWMCAIAAILVCGVLVYFLTQFIIIKPIREINYIAGKLSQGEVDKRVSINSRDEIGELANSFNIMADSLEAVDMHRKDFISNVSHELRSPITSIKGFIGGILDGVIPKDREEYYLKVTYEEIQRLTRLVNDLLDLSTIESGKFTLKIKQIEINELIRLSIIKFENKIKEKKVNVEVMLTEDDIYTLGDKDRIVQVITNLIDNSVKYVSIGGNIKINTKPKGDKILVSIFNDGPHIPEKDILHIWDRFYRADKARSSKSSTGLGLPIVRNILTQHGEDIWVENIPEKGVNFTFTLKRI
ncbi:MAG TPA: HAMP domain-containing sensor histidine kinase [Clostridiaceae bacterium]